MNGESGGRPVRAGVSPLLQVVIAAGVLVWIAATVLPLVRGGGGVPGQRPKEQMIYMMNPNNNANPGELAQLLEQGWRIAHVSSAGAPQEHSASHRFLLVLEDPATKQSGWWFINPYAPEGVPPGLIDQLQKGHRITQASTAGTTQGAGWTYRTVFVLER